MVLLRNWNVPFCTDGEQKISSKMEEYQTHQRSSSVTASDGAHSVEPAADSNEDALKTLYMTSGRSPQIIKLADHLTSISLWLWLEKRGKREKGYRRANNWNDLFSVFEMTMKVQFCCKTVYGFCHVLKTVCQADFACYCTSLLILSCYGLVC